mmetsp:Transcript_1750/g.3068  ORF Transcript_1750/g.3068 Transcript_1750/m.3068 type:complete len:200 (+) Transcript_1750:154-753(+)
MLSSFSPFRGHRPSAAAAAASGSHCPRRPPWGAGTAAAPAAPRSPGAPTRGGTVNRCLVARSDHGGWANHQSLRGPPFRKPLSPWLPTSVLRTKIATGCSLPAHVLPAAAWAADSRWGATVSAGRWVSNSRPTDQTFVARSSTSWTLWTLWALWALRQGALQVAPRAAAPALPARPASQPEAAEGLAACGEKETWAAGC